MPIKSASDKIIREMELFGQNFENYVEPSADDVRYYSRSVRYQYLFYFPV